MMDELEDRDLMVVTNFINLIDNHEEWLFNGVSEDAVLDWFGRSVLGRKSIVHFMRMNFSRVQHTIENVKRIPPINHRLLKHFVSDVAPSSDKLVLECGQGDCLEKITPKILVRPNLKELIKAPQKKCYHQQCSVNYQHWQFVEIKGKLTIEQNSDEVKHFAERNIQRIVLGYSDQIHFIVYEAKGLCRKKLSMCNVPDK